MSTEEPDDLEAKVRAIVNDELEKQDQNDGSVSMSRRGLLAGALGLGVGGAGLGSYGTQRVAAQDSTTGGYIGTESNPVGTIHADSIHTEVLDELDIQGKDISVASADVTNGVSAASVSTGEINAELYPQTASEIKTALEDSPDGTNIVLPQGEFDIDNPLNVTTSIRVQGKGARGGGTTLNKTNDAPLIDIGDCIPVLDNFRVTSDISDTTPGIHSIENSSTPLFLSRVFVNNCGSHGFHLEHGNLAGLHDLEASYNDGDGMRTGPASGGVADANAYTLTNYNARGNNGYGYNNVGSYGVKVVGGYIHNSGETTAWRAGHQDGSYLGIGAENDHDATITVDGNRNFIIIGNSIAPDPEPYNNGNRNIIFHPRKSNIPLYQGELQARAIEANRPASSGESAEFYQPQDEHARIEWNGGARLYSDGTHVYAVDSSGNETQLT